MSETWLQEGPPGIWGWREGLQAICSSSSPQQWGCLPAG